MLELSSIVHLLIHVKQTGYSLFMHLWHTFARGYFKKKQKF